MKKRVEGKVVLVTGGGSGIGRGTCLKLAEEGAIVAVTDINDKEGKDVVEQILKSGGTAQYWHMDTSIESQISTVISQIVETFGKLDALVNNAGIGGGEFKPTHELTESEWDSVMDINTKGMFLGTKYVIPHMIKNNGGSIVYISSVAGIKGSAFVKSVYHVSKGAVRLLAKADALTYAKDKIRVNSVHPGLINTAIWGNLLTERPPAEFFKAGQPLPKEGLPEDVANGILFLISDESSFMTGSELIIDGGMTA